MDKMKKGDIVMIYNSLTATGEDIEEGKARLIDKYRQGDTGEWWDVEFLEEKGEIYQRFIKY